jgi:NAD(P)-dependent dehydrogenase (short-subunit alcohol dehydrogenase family)
VAGCLQGKVAIITGAASGIGLASAELFIREGARVVAADIDDGGGQALAARFPGDLAYVHADVTDDGQVEALVAAAAERFGQLDVMFNNAGRLGGQSPLIDCDLTAFHAMIAVLTQSVVSGQKHAARQFRRQGTGGSIITTASAAGVQGAWANAGYTAAKHAAIGVVRQATAELAPLGIRSNAICPGMIVTPALAAAIAPGRPAAEVAPLLADRLAGQQPVRRAGRPEDVAQAALFFASDASSWISGAALPVDGGATAVTLGDIGGAVVKVLGDLGTSG